MNASEKEIAKSAFQAGYTATLTRGPFDVDVAFETWWASVEKAEAKMYATPPASKGSYPQFHEMSSSIFALQDEREPVILQPGDRCIDQSPDRD